MRTFRRAASSLLANLVEPLDADIFVHTWNRTGNTNKLILSLPKGFHLALPREYWHDNPDVLASTSSLFQSALPNLYGELQRIADTTSEITDGEVSAIYEPVSYSIEEFNGDKFERLLNISHLKTLVADTTMFNAAPMFYKIYACDLLRQNYEAAKGFRYDIVIRVRPDLFFGQEVQFDLNIIKGRLFTLHNPFYEIVNRSDLSNDMLFVGDSHTMTYAASVWHELPRIWDPAEFLEWPLAERGPEKTLHYHLSRRGLEGDVLRIDPAPLRLVNQVGYESMLELVRKDVEEIGTIPSFLPTCVSICQSIHGVDLYLSGSKEMAARVLAQTVQMNGTRFPEPFIGRAKIAALNGDRSSMLSSLASAKKVGQDVAFPELN